MSHIAGNSLLLPGPPSVVRPLPPRSSHRRRSLIFLYNSSCRFSHAAAAPPLGIPCGIPRCSVRFPPVFLRKTTPFSGHLPSGRPKTAGKISPGVPSVHLSFSSHGRLRRRVQPYGFTRFAFHHFQQNRPRFFLELRRVFQDFHGTARNPSPAPPPTHCMICWIFTFGAMLFASLQRSPFSLPGLSTTVSWIFVGFFSDPTALSSVFSPVDTSHFPGDFMAKSFHLKYSLPNLSLSDGHFFLRSILFLLSCHTLLAKTTGFFVNRVIG